MADNITKEKMIKGRGDSGDKGSGTLQEGHMDKTKGEGGSKGGRWVWLALGEVVGRKWRQL